MADSAIDYVNLTRICEFTRVLHRFHQTGGDEVIDREFNAVCRATWGYKSLSGIGRRPYVRMRLLYMAAGLSRDRVMRVAWVAHSI
jgi:hypothetical protein